MSIPTDYNTLEKMQNMQNMQNMLGNGLLELLKPSIKSNQKDNENIFKMLDLAKDKPESYLELLSVAIIHHNIPVIKYFMDKMTLTENGSPYINALSFYNSILKDDSKEKLTESKESYIDFQIPYIIMVGIGGHVDIFEKFMNEKLIINKNLTGIIGLSKKHKNAFFSNVIGACAFYGHSKLINFILRNYKEKDEINIDYLTTEKKAKNSKLSFSKEYTGCTPSMLAIVGPTSDEYTLDVLKTLKEYGAIFDISNWNKDNILHLATKNDKLNCAKYICDELGLNNLANDINNDGHTPLSLAQHLNKDEFIKYFNEINLDEKKKIEENLNELLAESVKKEPTKKGKKKKGKKKGKKDDNDEDVPNYMGFSEYQETLKESIPKPEEEKPEQKQEDNFIIGLNFKNNKKNRKLKLVDKHKTETNTKKEKEISNNNINSNINNINNIMPETEPEKNIEANIEKEIPKEKEEEPKTEKKIKPKKIKKEKRTDKEANDDFIEKMRKKEKERQEQRKLEKEKRRKEQEEKEQKEKEEQLKKEQEEKLIREREEKQRQEELKRQEELRLKEEEEEEKSEKDELSYTNEENNINNMNNNISEEKEEEKDIEVSLEDYEKLNKNYLELEKRLSSLEQEKAQLTSCLTKLYLENKTKNEYKPDSNEENINDLMYLANKELANKNEIINDLENKLSMLDLTNIKNFSEDKLKKYKDFYTKNLQIVNDAIKSIE